METPYLALMAASDSSALHSQFNSGGIDTPLIGGIVGICYFIGVMLLLMYMHRKDKSEYQPVTFTKQEILGIMRAGLQVTHRFMEPHEWVKLLPDGYIGFSCGNKLDPTTFWADRNNEGWDTGWMIYEDGNKKGGVK